MEEQLAVRPRNAVKHVMKVSARKRMMNAEYSVALGCTGLENTAILLILMVFLGALKEVKSESVPTVQLDMEHLNVIHVKKTHGVTEQLLALLLITVKLLSTQRRSAPNALQDMDSSTTKQNALPVKETHGVMEPQYARMAQVIVRKAHTLPTAVQSVKEDMN